jgi:hypothetical protein
MIDEGITTLPLTATQKLRLLGGSLRVVGALLPFALYTLFLTSIFGPPPLVFYALAAAVAIFVGHESLRDCRDLLHGVVCVREDVLERSHASRRGRRHFFGQFRTLGRVSMTAAAHFGSRPGAAHRVTYSPISRFVWSAEPTSPYR